MNDEHKGHRVLRQVEPAQTIAQLLAEARQLRERIYGVLDDLIAGDRQQCDLPPAILRSIRLAPFHNQTCPCAWLQAQAEHHNDGSD